MEYEERGRRNDDVQFETIRAEKVNFGRNNFLEVARKRAKTSEGRSEIHFRVARLLSPGQIGAIQAFPHDPR